MSANSDQPSVVYLIGAGASHACVEFVGSVRGILMRHLNPLLAKAVRQLATAGENPNQTVMSLVNAVVDENTDFEHLITFLDESPSALHRKFANELREIFEKVLRQQLDSIQAEVGADRLKLYSALLDMHKVEGFPEDLKAILTINYDNYIEEAVKKTYGSSIDFGVHVEGETRRDDSLVLLKLHGSFGWADEWPIHKFDGLSTLWIPPGIQKQKERYPFNVVWGRAREVLDCDILRIVGCRLSGSDWDLVSLLFTTRHANMKGRTYTVEVIDSPAHARDLQKQYPYLDIRSILEIEEYGVGEQIVGEYLRSTPQDFQSLSPDVQKRIVDAMPDDENWFRLWLVQMAEALSVEPTIGSIETATGEFGALLSA